MLNCIDQLEKQRKSANLDEQSAADKSFTEFNFMSKTKSSSKQSSRQRERSKNAAKAEVQGKYSQLTEQMLSRISPYEIKVT